MQQTSDVQMYKQQLAQKKRKEALRRLSQTGRRSSSSSTRRTLPSSSPKTSHNNPFFAALGVSNPPQQKQDNDNVFLLQLTANQKDNDQGHSLSISPTTSKPLSYAAAVKRKTLSNQSMETVQKPLVPMSSSSGSVNPFLQTTADTSSASLHLKKVPDQFNNKEFLLLHFNQFGPVSKIQCHPEKKFAQVHFTTKEAAMLAKRHGRSLSSDTPPIAIFWYADKPKPNNSGNQTSVFSRLDTNVVDPDSRDPRFVAGVKRKRRNDDDESEYVPTQAEVHQQYSDDENNMEEIDEGRDSVLTEIPPDDDAKMDTIARVPKHSYYLRSLHQPEYGTTSRSKVEYVLPVLNLPRPPVPHGKTAQDMFEALDARDKEIRKGIVKSTSLNAKAKVGCCPDMCPEKERYEREYQRRLSIFEIDQNASTDQNPRVDHMLAIKEYSRAAADKEEPLPHELRPLPVLMMTMDHIVTVIMDEGLDHVSEWYNFIWDRTRSIATDMVYQQLCEPECATLLERFTRFHILCSYILCEEEMKVFDQKLNTETIGRHIQSLKELYQDLSKKGISCENEPEFCSYDILLHLNDGTSFSKVNQYSHRARNSTEVKIALAIAQTIDSNNFVRFFKLVRKSSFLCACILHRYFNQIRLRALKTLNNSHSPGIGKVMHFLLSDLTRMLAFPSDDETAEFCSCVGLNVVKDRVQFQRGITVEPDDMLLVKLDEHLISSKNDASLGEVVYGGPLPPVPRHTPHCSFTAADQPQVNEEVCPVKPQINQEEMVAIVTGIQDVVVSEEVRAVAMETIEQEERNEMINRIANNVLESLLADVVGVASQEICSSVLLSLLQERERQDMQKMKDLIVLETANVVTSHAVLEESRLIAMETINEAIIEAEIRDNAIEVVASLVLGVVCKELIVEVTKEAIRDEKKIRNNRLRQLAIELKKFKLQQYWNRWLKAYKWCQYIRKTVNEFPSSGPFLSLSTQLDHVMSSVDHMTLDSNTPPLKRKQIDTSFINSRPFFDWEKIFAESKRLLAPIDFNSLHEKLFPRCHGNDVREWNLLVVGDNHIVEHPIWVWLENKLNVDKYDESLLKVSTEFTSLSEFKFSRVMSSIFLILSPPTDLISSESYTQYVVQSVKFLNESLPRFLKLPLVILTPLPLELVYKLDLIKAIEIVNYSILSEVIIESITVDNQDWIQNEQNLINIIEWSLVHSDRELPKVQWIDFKQYLYQVLSENFVKHVTDESKTRENAQLPSQDPNVIILLYNDVIQFIINNLTPPTTNCIPITVAQLPITTNHWTPPEQSLLSEVKSTLESLKLPHLPSSCDTQSIHDCIKYISCITNSTSLLSRVKLLIKSSIYIPWAQIILICTNYKLETITVPVVVGIPNDTVQYKLPTEWISATVDTVLLESTCTRYYRKRRHSDPVYHPPVVKAESRLNKTLQSDADGLNMSLKLEIMDSIEYQKNLEMLMTSSIDERNTPLKRIYHETKPESFEDQLVTFEHGIKSLKWKERTDYLILNSVL